MRDILIVEDGLNERERLSRLFTGAHYLVDTAESVQEAEALLNLNKYRLAVIDIGLGDKSGSYLFELLKRSAKVPFVVILTGNPSIHLKQRFLDDGAAAYVVKASPAAANEALLDLVRSLLGASPAERCAGIPLAEFLKQYVNAASRELFLDKDHLVPSCPQCGATDLMVVFDQKTQLPPSVEGKVVCAQCLSDFDPEVG